MNELTSILRDLQNGTLTLEQALARIEADRPSAGVVAEPDGTGLGTSPYARLDVGREARTGFPEVIYGEGKTAEQIAAIFTRMIASGGERVLATRIDAAKAEAVLAAVPDARYHESGRLVSWQSGGGEPLYDGYVAVVCAGTSDLPVAEEAAVTLESMGSRVVRIYDVGVAGIHRLFARLDDIRGANAVVVIAGMEGALASVVGGLVDKPIVAVPTSIGYGAHFGGLSPLLSMLNACAPGIAVVNIDNGFGGGYYAGLINRNLTRRS